MFRFSISGLFLFLAGFRGHILAKATLVTAALTHFTYVALVGTLILAGTGVPIPEDVPLIFSGYLCNKEHSPIKNVPPRLVDTDGDGVKEEVQRRVPHLWLMMLSGMVGVLFGDSIVFTIGRHGIESNNIVARHLRTVMHSKRREKVERHFARHGNLTVFVGRFMPGFRAIVFAFAGLSRMSYVHFLVIDGIAAAISVPAFIYFGWYFADRINWVLAWADRIKHWALPILVVGIAVLVMVYFLKRRKAVPAT